jgi:hypothetical protein
MQLSKAIAKTLLDDLMYGNEGAKVWVDDVWSLSGYLGQGAAMASEILVRMMEVLSVQQLGTLMGELYQAHRDVIRELDTAEQWQALFEG